MCPYGNRGGSAAFVGDERGAAERVDRVVVGPPSAPSRPPRLRSGVERRAEAGLQERQPLRGGVPVGAKVEGGQPEQVRRTGQRLGPAVANAVVAQAEGRQV